MSSNLRILAALLTCVVSCVTPMAFAHAAGEPNDDLPVYLDRALAASSEDSCNPGFIWQGAGNPNSTFQRKTNPDAGVELGIKGIFRQGADIRSSYVDGDGLVHIEVPAGSQITPVPVPNRAAWNFTYSYNVSLDGTNPDLSEYDAQLWIDLDPSEKVKYLKLTLAPGGLPIQPNPCLEPDSNGYRWKSGSTVVIGDDEGTAKVTQNSQNYAFYAQLIDADKDTAGVQPYTFGPAQFDVVLKLKRKQGGDGWTTLHVVFDVVSGPVPTP